MNWITYSVGNTRANNTMPMSIGAPQVHASGQFTAAPSVVTDVIGVPGLDTRGVVGRAGIVPPLTMFLLSLVRGLL